MSDRFINLEIGGAPLVMYGAIATTVAVIAYATISGGFGDSAAKAVGMQTTPTPESPKEKEQTPKEKEPTPEEKPAEEKPSEEKTQGGKNGKKGGSKKKKHDNKKRRKTPRRKAC